MKSFRSHLSESASLIADPCEYLRWISNQKSRHVLCGQPEVVKPNSDADALSCALDLWFSHQWNAESHEKRKATAAMILGTLTCTDPMARRWAVAGAEPGKRVYRGLSRTFDDLKAVEFTDRTTHMFGADRQSGRKIQSHYFHAVGRYAPTLPIQSWTTDPVTASGFSSFGAKQGNYSDMVSCLMTKKVRGIDEVVFGPVATESMTRHARGESEVVIHHKGSETMTYLIDAVALGSRIARLAAPRGDKRDLTPAISSEDDILPTLVSLFGAANARTLTRVGPFMDRLTARIKLPYFSR